MSLRTDDVPGAVEQVDIKRSHRWLIAWADLIDGLLGVITFGHRFKYWPLSLRGHVDGRFVR